MHLAVAGLCTDARHASRVRAGLPAGVAAELSADWSALARRTAGAGCAIVWLEWLGRAEDFGNLVTFRARCPACPVVLVTQRDADNARHLKDVLVEEVVWQHEVARELWPAIERARARGVLALCAAGLESAARLPPPLRRGLVLACAGPRPIQSVSALAETVGCDRRTLWRHWHAAAERSPSTLQDVLDWLLLLRARGGKSADASWRAVAAELRVHEHTLARLARRLARRTLRELAEAPVAALFDEFSARVLEPLDRTARAPSPGERETGPRLAADVGSRQRGGDRLAGRGAG
jgi:hypothetical protein